jgi:hypothetical protein
MEFYIDCNNNTELPITVSTWKKVNDRVSRYEDTIIPPNKIVTIYSTTGHWTISTLFCEEFYHVEWEEKNLTGYRNLATINNEHNIYGDYTDNIVDSYFKLVYDKENNTVTWSRRPVTW